MGKTFGAGVRNSPARVNYARKLPQCRFVPFIRRTQFKIVYILSVHTCDRRVLEGLTALNH